VFGAPKIDVTVTTANGARTILVTSQTPGIASSVRVLPGDTKDAASRLKLGAAFGGVESDAAALVRPRQIPDHGALTSGVFAAANELDAIPSAHSTLIVELDGQQSTIVLDGPDLTGALAKRLSDLATLLQAKVRAAAPGKAAFSGFTATAAPTKLVLESGTRGDGSTIRILPSGADTLATVLKLTEAAGADVAKATGVATLLAGGNENPLDLDAAYTDFIGSRANREGIYALESVDMFNLLVLAGVSDAGVLADAAAYCKERRAFLIADSPSTIKKPADMEALSRTPALPKSSYAAVYYPWVRIADPTKNGKLRSVPPSGTIAGVYARTDSTRGVWKAPAGTEAGLAGVQDVDYVLTDPENGTLNPRAVNCIRNFPVFGAVSWGARTLDGDDEKASEWKYVPVRRLALYIEESLYRGTKWAVFEPNDEPLWAQLRLNMGAFMQTLFRQGAFQGQTPRDAYFVRCGRDTTTQNDVNLGIVNIIVGFAPLKPAEFVVIKLQQMAGQIAT
jgi:phage tail sheath protein FI